MRKIKFSGIKSGLELEGHVAACPFFLKGFLLLLIVSCGRPAERVWVDLSSIPLPTTPQAPFKTPVPPAPIPTATHTQRGFVGQTLKDPNPNRAKLARDLIVATRIQAQQELTERLREIYSLESKRLEQEKLSGLDPKKQALWEAAQQEVRTLFKTYADERGPLLVDQAVVRASRYYRAVLPDQPPKLMLENHSDDQRLTLAIATLDADFESKIRKIFAQVQDKIDQDLTATLQELARMRGQANQRAEEEAKRQAEKNEQELSLKLGQKTEIYLPPVPAQSVTVPGASPIPKPPVVTPRSVAESEKEQKQLLAGQLKIWLAVNGYRQADSKQQGRDATEEFLKWKQLHNAGR